MADLPSRRLTRAQRVIVALFVVVYGALLLAPPLYEAGLL